MSLTLACIGGRAAFDLLHNGALSAERLGSQDTPFGPSQPIYRCACEYGDFLYLCRHGENGYETTSSFINYRANIYALRSMDTDAIISWSETRAVSHNYNIGQYVVIDDLIDETVSRPRTFFENRWLGRLRHWPVFCPRLQEAFVEALKREDCTHADRGVYVCIEGPRQETPAEARKYAVLGGDLIGDTLAPEVFLAKELEMHYASLCYVARYAETGTRYAAFEDGRVLEESVLQGRAASAVERLPKVIEHVCAFMQKNGLEVDEPMDVGPRRTADLDWRQWFSEMSERRNHEEETT